MIEVIAALFPIFAIIAIGYGLRQRTNIGDSVWQGLESLVYYLFFPSLLFLNLSRTDLSALDIGPMALSMIGPILVASGLLLTLRRPINRWLHKDVSTVCNHNGAFTTVFQGSIRPNTYVALAAAVALFGEAGATLTILAIATVIPLVNVIAVIVLSVFAEGKSTDLKKIILGVVSNPIIVACVAGVLFNAVGLSWTSVIGGMIEESLDLLARAALPLGLIAVGAGLKIQTLATGNKAIILATSLKLLVLPLLTVGLCWSLGVSGLTATIAMMFNALPVSAASYVLSRQMGGDAPLMAGVLTAQTLAAAVTLPTLLALFG